MTDRLPRPESASSQDSASSQERASSQEHALSQERAPADGAAAARGQRRRILDCEVCVVGDDVAARALVLRLAALGRDVVQVTGPVDPGLPLDPVLAPGFALPARDMAARVGPSDAAELWALSRAAAARGRDLAQELDLALEAKGALLVAPPYAAEALFAEQEMLADLAPGASRLIGPRDLEGLLGTGAFAAAIGLVPAARIDRGPFAEGLGRRIAAAGIRVIAPAGPLGLDLNGLRKYLDMGEERIRAFDVVLCGTAALRQGAPELAAGLVATPFVAGRMALADPLPFAGRVELFSEAGLAFQVDGDELALAAQAAFAPWGRWSAGLIVGRRARKVYPGGRLGRVEAARGHTVARPRHRMPLAGAVAKGVWVAGGLDPQPLSAALLVAELIADAIALKDDRIALLEPFLAREPHGALGALRHAGAYWRARLGPLLARTGVPALPGARRPDGEAGPEDRGARLLKARDGGRRAGGVPAGSMGGMPAPPRSGGARRRPEDGA